jgi:hypothetical protein
MDTIPQEQLMTIGLVGLVIAAFFFIVVFVVMTGCFKVAVSLIGNRSPTFLASAGWLFLITFLSFGVSYTAYVIGGNGGVFVATPLVWFIPLYMISTAGDCGLFRAFCINIVYSLMTVFSLGLLFFLVTLPITVLGWGRDATRGEMQAKTDGEAASIESFAELGGDSQPQVNPVALEDSSVDDLFFRDSAPAEPEVAQTEAATVPPTRIEPGPEQAGAASKEQTKAATSESLPKKHRDGVRQRRRAKRMSDGTQLNPFFQD